MDMFSVARFLSQAEMIFFTLPTVPIEGFVFFVSQALWGPWDFCVW